MTLTLPRPSMHSEHFADHLPLFFAVQLPNINQKMRGVSV